MSVSDLKAQKRVRQLLKGADTQGWQTRRGDRNWVPTDPMTLYVYDLATGYLASTVLNAEDFVRVATAHSDVPANRMWEDAGTMIAAVADGKVPPHLQQQAVKCMFYVANRYAGVTQAYHLAPPAEGPHFAAVCDAPARQQRRHGR